MGQTADTIVASANLTLIYAQQLLKDIKAEQFARRPVVGGTVIETNHPAFVYGHLSLYARRAAAAVGRESAVAPHPAGFEGLFKNGVACQDDPSGTIYPSMQAITEYYFAATKAAVEAVRGADEAVFARPNPAEGRMKELFPTIGGAVNFYLGAHSMSHLGQVSAWRRCVGLGSAM